jgi:hypothetical protein
MDGPGTPQRRNPFSMGREESGSTGVYPERQPEPTRIVRGTLVRGDDLWVFPFGADDLGPEIGSGYERPAPVFADRRCAYEVPFRLSERWDESEDFWREAVDGDERVLELAYAC